MAFIKTRAIATVLKKEKCFWSNNKYVLMKYILSINQRLNKYSANNKTRVLNLKREVGIDIKSKETSS